MKGMFMFNSQQYICNNTLVISTDFLKPNYLSKRPLCLLQPKCHKFIKVILTTSSPNPGYADLWAFQQVLGAYIPTALTIFSWGHIALGGIFVEI